MRSHFVALFSSVAVVLCAASHVEAQCFCQSAADCGGATCVANQCTGLQCCPLPALPHICMFRQVTDCLNPSAGELCLAQAVVINSATGQPEAQQCDCFDNSLCGPVYVTPIAGAYDFRCQGNCPAGQVGLCQIHFNGMPQGVDHVSSAAVPAGATVTCSCLPVQQTCPLPGPAPDPCASLQSSQCTNPTTPNDQCLPKCVNFGPAGVTQCDCAGPNECHFDMATNDCVGGCPNAGENCVTTVIIEADGTDTICCNCEGVPPQVCPLPSDPATDPCAALQASQCNDPTTPDDHCFPICVSFGAAGSTVTQCDCTGPNECHFDLALNACMGDCPPGENCIEMTMRNADGTTTICCDCEGPPPQTGACCYDADGDGLPDTCAVMTATDCANFSGTFQGVGSTCLGVEACCVNGAAGQFCVNIDRLCCDDIGGVPQGSGSVCGNVGACCLDFNDGPLTYDTCIGMIDELCCDDIGGVSAGTDCERVSCCLPGGFCQEADPECCIASGGTGNPNEICGMDANNNGIDDACEEPCPLPTPPPAIDPCSMLQSIDCDDPTNPADQCLPVCVNFNPNAPDPITVLECDCRFSDECHVQLVQGALPHCVGICPPGETCVQSNVTNADGSTDICCNCEPQTGACCFDSDGDGINDACTVLSMQACAAAGGTFQGVGSVCLGVGACCFGIAGGGCVEVDALCCDDIMGTFQGVGTMCLGDGNANGLDDACEPVCEEPPGQDSCAALQSTDCVSTTANEVCLPKCVRIVGNEEVVITFEKDNPGEILVPGVGVFVGDNLALIGLNPTASPTHQTRIDNFFRNTGPVEMTFQFVNAPLPPPPPPPPGQCPADRFCMSPQECIFDGLMNLSLGNASLSITPAPECNLLVANIGSSGEDGATQDPLPPGTCEMATGLATPNFSLSQLGTAADIRMYGDVPGGLMSRLLIENIDNDNLRAQADISPVGVTLYAIQVYDGDQLVAQIDDQPNAQVIFGKDDIVVVDCHLIIKQKPVVEECDCLEQGVCGPVQITPITGTNDFNLSCNGDCPAPEVCQVFIDGNPMGVTRVNASEVPIGSLVKCDCAPPPFCELPSPPEVALCTAAQQASQCTNGTVGEQCLPGIVLIGPDGLPFAEICDCFGGGCGPVHAEPTPIPEVYNLFCPEMCPVPPPGNDCQIHVNGLPTGQSSIFSNAVPPGSIITCDCAACVPPPGNMTAWWPLDETSGTSSGEEINGNDGLHVGGPSPLAGQYVDNSLCFDGVNDYVQVPNAPQLNFGTGDFSIDAWIRTTDTVGVKVIVDKRNEVASGVIGYSLFVSSGNLAFQIADGAGSAACAPCPTGSSCTNYGSGAFVASGNWTHVAVTVSRTTNGGTFYVNGAFAGTFNPDCHPNTITNSRPLRIGSRSSSVSGLFNGCIDEVELFNVALPATVINELYQAGAVGKCKCEPTPDGSGCEPIGCMGGAAGQEQCRPSCVNFHQGAPQPITVLDCDCLTPQECHVEAPPGVVPFCEGFCPPGQICVETIVDNPVLGGIDVCCECESPCPPCVGDINGDGVVNPFDLALLLGAWGTPACGGASPCCQDINGDGSVNPFDLALLLGNWGPCP